MVIHDFNVVGSFLRPPEADSILVVDPDGVLPIPITLQFLEPQPGKGERFQGHGGSQLVEGLRGPGMKVRGKGLPGSPGILSVEDVLRALAFEGDDQTAFPFVPG